jgi:hypothetical protein
MAVSSMGKVIQHLHNVILRQEAETRSDGQLLDSFIKQRDAAALETLVRRHAPSKEQRLAQALSEYEQACQADNAVLARQWATHALAIDPTCFRKALK